MSSASCLWSTVDPSGAYPVNQGGWVSTVDLRYSQHALRPSFRTITGLSGPSVSADEHVDNFLGDFREKKRQFSSGGLFVQRFQLLVKNFLAFPGMRFEVYGCDDADLFVGGREFVDVGNVTCGENITAGGHLAYLDGEGRDILTKEQCQQVCQRPGQSCGAYSFTNQIVYGGRCWVYGSDCRSPVNASTLIDMGVYPKTFKRTLPVRNKCDGHFVKPLVFGYGKQKILKSLTTSSTLFNYDRRVVKTIDHTVTEDIRRVQDYKRRGIFDYFQPGSSLGR